MSQKLSQYGIQDILSYVSKFGSISISEAEIMMPEINRRSIQRRLKKLVDDGYLDMVGETREAKYTNKRWRLFICHREPCTSRVGEIKLKPMNLVLAKFFLCIFSYSFRLDRQCF